MRLLIVRHAESVGNASGNYGTAQADSLSPVGLAQAGRLADALGRDPFDRILVSPLQRALQTVAPFLEANDGTAEVWPELAEACWHETREPPDPTWDRAPATLPDSVPHARFAFRDGAPIRPGHPETFGMGLRRVHDALERLESEKGATDRRILLVAHGHFIRELLTLMLCPAEPQAYHHDNCGMTTVMYRSGWTLASCNRTPDAAP